MANSTIKKSSKFLIIGGGGLVGKSFLELLLKKGYRNVFVVSLKNEREVKNLQSLRREYNHPIKQYWANVLVPKKLQQYSIDEIVSNQKRKKILIDYIEKPFDNDKIEKESVLFQLMKNEKPNYIIDCINSATQCSYIDHSGKSYLGSGIGLNILLRYYQIINHLFNNDFWKQRKNEIKLDSYLKVGTTGIGGMGFDMPFTHGEEKPSMSLLKKVAMAGAQQMLLFAMQNNRSKIKIIEVVPATAVFSKTINDKVNKNNHLNIDGGESGGYSLEEFRLLSDQSQMGFIDSESLAVKIFNVLSKRETKNNVLSSLESGVIRPSKQANEMRRKILLKGGEILKERGLECVAHGSLGPKKVQKMLYESKIFSDFFQENKNNFFTYKPDILSLNISKIVKKNLKLQKEIKESKFIVKYRASIQKKNIKKDINDDILDLSPTNCKKWQLRFKKFGFNTRKQHIDPPGRIVSKLISLNDL